VEINCRNNEMKLGAIYLISNHLYKWYKYY